MTVTPAQNGVTIHMALGTEVIAADFPSPAQPMSSNTAILAPGMSPMVIICHPPGTPCTLPPMTFVARARGTARISAHRDMCGEARRCVPPYDWTDVAVTVVVE